MAESPADRKARLERVAEERRQKQADDQEAARTAAAEKQARKNLDAKDDESRRG